jgi:predicted nucleic acid-binding protein
MAFRVFLDANVILDYVLKRNNYLEVRKLFQLEENLKIGFYISSSIVHILGYYLTKALGADVAKTTLLILLKHIKIAEGDHDTCVLALAGKNLDIEDALQYEIAIKNKIHYFISSDKKFQKFSNSQLPIIDIPEAIAIFSNTKL